MPKNRTIIELLPTRMLLAVTRAGRLVEHRSHPIADPEFMVCWPHALGALRPVLAKWVADLHLAGTETTILYAAPSSSAAVYSCPATAGRPDALRAAELAIRGAGNFTAGASTLDLQPLASALRGHAHAAADQHLHTLAAADTNQSTSALAAWASATGLQPTQILPGDIPPLLAATQTLARQHAMTAWMWFGEHSSIIAAGNQDALRFVRTISLGTESLAEALTRPMRSTQPNGSAITLDRQAARRLLYRAGIPAPEVIVDHTLGITGSAMLPLLQPILQRIAIELKQSLRYGLSDAERTEIALRLDGAGSLISNLGSSLAQSAGITAAPGGATPPAAVGELIGDPAAGDGTVAAWSVLPACTLNLLPLDIENHATMHKVRSRALAGFVGAAALITLYGGTTFLTLRTERHRLDALRIGASTAAHDGGLQASARLAEHQHTLITQRVARELGESPPIGDLLAAISAAIPERVKLTSLSINASGPYTAGAPSPVVTCSVEAFAQTGDPQQLAGVLHDLSISLGKLPMVASLKLGSAHRTEVRGAPAQKFDFSLTLVGLPHPLARWQTADALPLRNGENQ